ncbi:protein trapped in endoderm-1 [Parasteatoda tepidariorum]|uniref:protein trapped in endoderm-1 n=1 Tax=Parasteatoda tepidariorum TaxID=114398 RepID=UPI00077FAC82|nr:protein trapped in endoderm-1 [Parasteatoda tepidariorum]XP_015915366.1 protein trapped in endoderm-1 [Parasteatoda tepidariorum]
MDDVTYLLSANQSVESGSVTQDSNSTSIIASPQEYSRVITLFAAVCCIFFIIFGLFGNLVTILALSKCQKLRNATTAFVISLCTADLLFCALNLPPTASRYINQGWILGDTLCKLFPFFFYGNVAASLMSMTAITINRYILINHYKYYDKIYQRKFIALMIAFCWLFSFLMLTPTLAGAWGEFGYKEKTFSCTILKKNGSSPKKFLFVLGFLLPCVIIVISYSCIFYRVHKSRKNVEAHSPTPTKTPGGVSSPAPLMRQLSHRQDEIRLTRMMLIIFCSFLMCFLPLMIANVLEDKMDVPTIHTVASILAWMSSCINPIIYAAMNRQYRQAYVRLFCGAKRRLGNTNSSSSNCRSGSGHSKTLMSEVFVFNGTANGNGHCVTNNEKNKQQKEENKM